MSDSKTRRARLTLAALGILVVGALVGGGVTAATLLGGDDKPPAGATPPPSTSSGSSPSQSRDALTGRTPESARRFVLEKPSGQKNGLSTGFSEGPVGAVSTAVYFWEEFAFLDDQKARQQLEAIVSPDSPGYVDEQVSGVRKLREGVGLPPSGGAPAGITFTTTVNAVRVTSVGSKVIQVWMNYDRYATKENGDLDGEPFKDQDVGLILKWQNGAWRITNEAKYKGSYPAAYFPDSNVSYRAGWRQVQHAG
ncbi:hypothetical protein L0F81_22355 [Streptomyces tricolor]|uniref:Integral membrane protein n=1 Tax=Streptomyces tricolor TaxID=68277 RepID=A0ABS9JKA8_9ACTN|nr:hypothetical protein [Streptomyces tricolor]MCG0066005.1 hypothetical protein [Streptomyces tricolor]